MMKTLSYIMVSVYLVLLMITGITGYSIYLSSGVNSPTYMQESESIFSSNGNVYLALHKDGNLVLYTNSNGAVWSTGTWGQTDDTFLTIHQDGNVCLYLTGNTSPIWCRDTTSPHIYDSGATAPYHLVVSNDGFVYLLNKNNAVYWHSDNYAGNNFPTFAGPTHSPSQSTTNIPTVSPTNIPTPSPTDNPTPSPTDNPTVSPTNNPTPSPTDIPTPSPTNDPTADPTRDPTRMPTTSPTVGDNTRLDVTHPGNGNGDVGEVGTTSGGNSVGNGNYEAPEKENTVNLPSWIYVIAGCGAMICCLAVFFVICKCRKKKGEWDSKFGNDDNYRFNTNQTNHKESMDVWSNPVHHQIGSASPSSIYEGNNMNNTTGIARIGSASLGVFDDEPSSGDELEHGQMYTVPVKKDKREQFGENLVNNAAAQSVVMDDIIGHMSTPMGDDNDDDEDDNTPTIEMVDFGGTAGENGNIVIPNYDKGVDDIDNNIIDDDNDDDIAGDIDQIITPNGGGDEDDNQIVGDIDNIIVTAGMNDDDDDIDDIDDIDVNTAGYVGHDHQEDDDDDDDMDDFVQTIQ